MTVTDIAIDVRDSSVTSQEIVGAINPMLWDRWIKSIQDDLRWQREVEADKLSDEEVSELAVWSAEDAISFLRLGRFEPDQIFSPSVIVDRAWHMLLERTLDYFPLCELLVGTYIHHMPTEDGEVDYGGVGSVETFSALQKHGLTVHERLWKGTADCKIGPCDGCCGTCNKPPSAT